MNKKLLLGCLFWLFAIANATAYDVVPVTGENYSYLFNIYNKGENLGVEMEGKPVISTFTILDNYRFPLFTAGKKWASVVGSTTLEPVTYSLVAENDWNAAAESVYTTVAGGPYKVTYVNAKINGLTPTGDPEEALPTDGLIFLGWGVDPDHPGWATFSGYHGLNHSELSDLNAVMLHEYMHSLGITTAATQYHAEQGDQTTYFSSGAGDPLSAYDKDLRLYQGSMLTPFDPTLELVPQEGMSIGEDETFDIFAYSPYLAGDNTIKVLGGNADYDDAKAAIIANGGFTNYSSYYEGRMMEFPQVYGMPIHPADQDGSGGYEIDLSHLELHNSFMSHQQYRNWLVPMEAELAVLKDSGYNIDLREHFGKSYYLNGVTDTFAGYSQWDGTSYTGVPSDTVQAVGLHIYGNDNTITQAGDVLTAGEGSFGVRIDGKGNEYTLQSGSLIQANGKENIGLGVTWGQNHQVTVESGSSVTAAQEDGIAVSFDFGANLFGLYGDAKGSYLNYSSTHETSVAPDLETRGALVDQFDVAGSLTGGKAAIYISDNAHVQNINLLDGALVNGHIISQWNSVKSAPQASVKRYNGEYWDDVDPSDPSQIYFTQLNTAGNVTVNGKIDGGNEIYNTLKLSNTGNLNVNGEVINVNSLENSGTLTLAQATSLNTQTGKINGNGTIEVQQELNLSEDLGTIENTISLSSGALFSTLNDKAQGPIQIDTLKSNGGKLAFDLGDSFDLQNDDPADDASIYQIKVSADQVDLLDDTSYTLFNSEVLNLGTSSANVYYNGNRYTFTQNSTNPQLLSIAQNMGGGELGDAVADPTAANYIVTDSTSLLTQDAGSVQGDSFEISGEDIDVNGHAGLVIDASNNPSGTTLLTGISGASDSDLTVQNGGKLEVSAQSKRIDLGKAGQTALALSNAEVMLDSENQVIVVAGDIQGTNPATDIVNAQGALVALNEVDNVTLHLNAQNTYLNNQVSNTAFELNGGALLVVQDDYLSGAGSNQIVVNGGAINVGNNKASDIALDKMTLQTDLVTGIDVDLQTMSADRFVFQNSADLDTQSHLLHLSYFNVLNPQAVLEGDSYVIPVVSADYHNDNFLGAVQADMEPYVLQSPIFRYQVSFEQNSTYAGLLLTHGPSSDYTSYNPAVFTGPVAAQTGGYLTQLSMNEQVFAQMDRHLSEARKDPVAGKLLAAAEGFHGTLADPKRASVWANPYAAYGKVPLKNGPKVTNTLYGAAAGIDSALQDIGRDWDGVLGFYMAYNGSRQRFEGVSMEQNGAGLGVSGMVYKNNFFAGLLAGGSASDVLSKTGYGREHSSLLTAGTAAKTGYIWELGSRGQWLLQPELIAAYTWVGGPDYTNKAGVRMKANSLQTVTLQPQLRLSGDWQKWGQPYAEVAWVGNLGNKTKFKANSVELPQFSVKPFMKYSLGIREAWAERWNGYLQTYFTSGGVRNVGVQAGISYAL